MGRDPEARSVQEAALLLTNALGEGAITSPDQHHWDVVVRKGRLLFGIEWRSMGDALRVGNAVEKLRFRGRARTRGAIPVLAVPFMGETGQRLCEEACLSWIDLSGNASVDAPGIRIRILGNPNRFAGNRRPPSLFAPRNSRVVRTLLLDPKRAYKQQELVQLSGLDKGRVSRVVRQLVGEEHLEKKDDGYRCVNPGGLLDAWQEAYDFSRHRIVRGILGGRDSYEVMQKLAEALDRRKIEYAVTGLAGAWLLTKHAMFRTVSLFVREALPSSLLDEIGLMQEPRGANVWLVVPNDDAVFTGVGTQEGMPCAHPLQVFLDLKAHPERAPEAAAEVRRRYLTWQAKA